MQLHERPAWLYLLVVRCNRRWGRSAYRGVVLLTNVPLSVRHYAVRLMTPFPVRVYVFTGTMESRGRVTIVLSDEVRHLSESHGSGDSSAHCFELSNGVSKAANEDT
jgi:hypothetical protein